MSCSEVMYQAYYPYLYQRPGTAPPVAAHPVPRNGPFTSAFGAAHQYDRFNVQRLQDAHSLSHHHQQQSSSSAGTSAANLSTHSAVSASSLRDGPSSSSAHQHDALYLHHHHHHHHHHPGSANSSGGSVSSTGGISPDSPLRPSKEEECSLHERSSTDDVQHGVEDDDSQDVASSRAQYVSANCVVFTHYQGDASAVVDEHFSRALDKSSSHTKDNSPMTSRNFPPSFWNSQHYGGAGGGGSSSHHGASAAEIYTDHYHPSEAWYQYSQHHHHRAVHEYHHHNMAAQYGGLLLPSSRLHMGSHASCKAMEWQHPSIDSPYSTYPPMSGLEAHQVQDSSKDLYWF